MWKVGEPLGRFIATATGVFSPPPPVAGANVDQVQILSRAVVCPLLSRISHARDPITFRPDLYAYNSGAQWGTPANSM